MGKVLSVNERARRGAVKSGLPFKTIRRRLQRGWTYRRAISTPKGNWIAKSYFRMAVKAGVNPSAFYARLKRGWSVKKALIPQLRPPNKKTIAYKAKKAGLKAQTVISRIRNRGCSLHEALTMKPGYFRQLVLSPRAVKDRHRLREKAHVASALLGRSVTTEEAKAIMRDLRVTGILPKYKDMNTVTYQSNKAGLKPMMVFHRLKRGWSIERALSTPPRDTTKSLAARAREAGLSVGAVSRRVNGLGWSIERALSTPVHHAPEYIQLAREAGLKPDTVEYRDGWSEERALSTPALR